MSIESIGGVTELAGAAGLPALPALPSVTAADGGAGFGAALTSGPRSGSRACTTPATCSPSRPRPATSRTSTST